MKLKKIEFFGPPVDGWAEVFAIMDDESSYLYKRSYPSIFYF